jgi:hypothetical protein
MVLVMAGAAVLLVAGCTDMFSSAENSSVKDIERPVRVVPTFHLEGTDKVPEQLRLEELGLAISEIELTPSSPDESVAYSSRAPMELDFQVEDGEIQLTGDELVLPETGTYDVSLRLEPTGSRPEATGGGQDRDYSMRMSGYVAGNGIVRVDRDDGENEDGRPVPFPASPDPDDEEDDVSDRPELPNQWTPFEYESEQSVVHTLDQVAISGDRQILSFSFDAEDWALELLEPLSRAVRRKETSPTGPDDQGSDTRVVDVTREIERLGRGPAGMEEHMSVRAIRPKESATSNP